MAPVIVDIDNDQLGDVVEDIDAILDAYDAGHIDLTPATRSVLDALLRPMLGRSAG